MATTYPKKLKTVEVHMMLDGTVQTLSDTVNDDAATRALNEFKNYGTAHMVVQNNTIAMPYHAVQYIKVTETDGTVTKADAYGCE